MLLLLATYISLSQMPVEIQTCVSEVSFLCFYTVITHVSITVLSCRTANWFATHQGRMVYFMHTFVCRLLDYVPYIEE